MGASSHKIEVPVTGMIVMGPEVAHLKDIMGKTSEYGTFRNIANMFPAFRRVADLELNMTFNIIEP
jgi:hypothetical protein